MAEAAGILNSVARRLVLLLCSWSMLASVAWQQEMIMPTFLETFPALVEISNTTGARIPCSASGNPQPEVTWLVADGSPLIPIRGLREIGLDGTLIFPPFKAEHFRQDVHATVYKCAVSNKVGTLVSNDVRIKAVVLQPYDVYVYDVFTMQGNTAVMRCNVPNFLDKYVVVTSWIRDSAVVISPDTSVEDSKYVLTATGELYIQNITSDDSMTTFKCQTTNKLTGEKKTSVTAGKLFVTDPMGNIAPKIVFSKKTIRVREGQNAFLPCEAQGNPVPEVTWTKHNFKTGLSLAEERFNQVSGSLTIFDAQESDAGVYICTATSIAGIAKIESELMVTGILEVSMEPTVMTANIGQTATMSCKISGFPKTAVSWIKDGQMVPFEGIEIINNTTLHIHSMSIDYTGIYQCFVKNAVDAAFGTTMLKLGDVPPALISVFHTHIHKPGEAMALQCIFSGSPTPEIKWWLDNEIIKIDQNIRQTESISEDGNLITTLPIRQLKVEDGGMYSCQASNEAGQVRHTSRCNVYGRLGARPRAEVAATSGETVILSCPFYGYPNSMVLWEKGDILLPFTLEEMILDDGRLSISNVQRSTSSGLYTCTVANADGDSVQGEVHLSVVVPPKLVPFSFQEELVREGMRGRLQCVVLEGDLPITLTWLKDGKPIPPSLGVIVKDIDEFSSILTVASISPRHNGNYTCLAKNPAAAVSFTARLAVNVSPKILPFTFPERGVVEGVLARVSCVVYQGDTPIRIQWLKQGKPISVSSGILVRNIDDYSSILTIENVRNDHAGNYSCIASNNAATVVHSSQLTVNVPPKIVPFSFQDEHLLEGMLVRVSCVVSRGDLPLTITWLKDSQRIPTNLSVSIRDFDEYSSVLSIEPVKSVHSGNYTCNVRNHAGMDFHVAELKVQVPPKWTIEPMDLTAHSGEDVYLHCKASGLPVPHIRWFWTKETRGQNKKSLVASHDVTVYSNGTVKLMQVTKSQEGTYFCAASNGVGSPLSRSAVLTVLAPPVLSNKRMAVIGQKGKHLTLKCSASGDLPLHFLWRSQDITIKPEKDSRFEIQTKNTSANTSVTSQLVIKWLDRKDSVLYKCQVENAFGRAVQIFDVMVQEPPESPTIVSSSASGNRSVPLTWTVPFDGNSKIVEYIVQYKKKADNWKIRVTNSSVNGDINMTTVTGLIPATKYIFRIAAKNSIGMGEFSAEYEATVDEDAPTGPPQNVEVESTDQHTLRVTWKPPHKLHWNGAIIGYNVGYKIEGSSEEYIFNTLEVPEDYTDDLIFQLTGLKMFSRYNIVVQAFNTKGSGPHSNPVMAMTSEDVPSKPPQEIRCSALSSNSIYVLWEQPANESVNGILRGYKVQYKPTTEWYETATQIRIVSTSKVTLQGLEVNTNYTINIQAFTKAGDGVKSAPVFCKTFEDVPEAPGDLKVLPASADSVVVAWKAPKNSNSAITKYKVYYKTIAEGQEFDPATQQSGDSALMEEQVSQEPSNYISRSDSQFLEVKGLKKNKKYAFWVTASSIIGEGPGSKVMAQTVADNHVPAKSASFSGTIKTPWKRDVVMPCKAVGVPSPQRKWMLGGKSIEAGNGKLLLSDGTLLLNQVASQDSGNYTCSIYNTHGSDEVNYSLMVQVPPSAPILDVVSKSQSSVQLQWKPGPNGGDSVRGYVLHFRQDSGPWETKELRSDYHLYTLDGLACGSNYQLYLEAFNTIGTGAPCDTITVSTQGNDTPNPPKESLIREGSTFATINLETWSASSCPVDHFQLAYKPINGREWTVVSENIQATQKKIIIPGLTPATWYSLRLTAVTTSGHNGVEYNFATPTMNGGTIPPPEIRREKTPDPVYVFYLDPYIFIPSVALLIVVIIAAVVICVCVKRKNGSMESLSDSASTLNTWPRGAHGMQAQYATIQRRDGKEINPYATSRLPECFAQYPGTAFFDQADPALVQAWAMGTIQRRPTQPSSGPRIDRNSLQRTSSDGSLPAMQESSFVLNKSTGFTPAKGNPRPDVDYDQPPVGI